MTRCVLVQWIDRGYPHSYYIPEDAVPADMMAELYSLRSLEPSDAVHAWLDDLERRGTEAGVVHEKGITTVPDGVVVTALFQMFYYGVVH